MLLVGPRMLTSWRKVPNAVSRHACATTISHGPCITSFDRQLKIPDHEEVMQTVVGSQETSSLEVVTSP